MGSWGREVASGEGESVSFKGVVVGRFTMLCTPRSMSVLQLDSIGYSFKNNVEREHDVGGVDCGNWGDMVGSRRT